MTGLRFLFTAVSFLLFATLKAQEEKTGKDTLVHALNGVEVTSRYASPTVSSQGRGRVTWNMAMMNDMPKILGNADPMHYAQMLPGVQTCNEYDSGIHIYGCDQTHNLIGLNGIPIYNSGHLLGLFSIFNASHFDRLSMQKLPGDAMFPNRLGGMISMDTRQTVSDSLEAEGSIGLISSQATVRIPLSRKSTLTLSGRLCYLNQLYGYALKADEAQLAYNFWDSNVSWLYTPDERNQFSVDGYWGGDAARLDNESYIADIRMRWGNEMVALHWNHAFTSNTHLKQSLFYSSYHNRFSLTQEELDFRMPSYIRDVGYRLEAQLNWLKTGLEWTEHFIRPQSPELRGSYNLKNLHGSESWHTRECVGYVNAQLLLHPTLLLDAGVRASLYAGKGMQTRSSADPSIALRWSHRTWDLTLSASSRHQYIFQTGFSSMGLPTEFWMTTNDRQRPQSGQSLSLSYGQSLGRDIFRLSAEAYYRRLWRQVEYEGTVYDFLNTEYLLDNQLLEGSGRCYGVNLMIAKVKGRLTGWVSYNVGRALRRFNDVRLEGSYPANHERIHEMNAVMTLRLGRRWSVGATGIVASGTPFTAPEYFYLYSGNILSQYGEHNACRLGSYIRLDLSVNYQFRSRKMKEHGLNLSVYNALARENEIFYAWKVHHSGEFHYRPVSFLAKVMPSVSYYFKF